MTDLTVHLRDERSGEVRVIPVPPRWRWMVTGAITAVVLLGAGLGWWVGGLFA